ncbi:O-unit flippase-like protein [Cellvibrio zantedeschiae]|uniref:O-unit flippase-like protein n=1 Tax=Cellvibrio zantedeschiae TaxID=1237077 RepID=UPI0016720C83|nr:O-unit flippase-like protein [Cellvibrio zantedeschiae]
MNAKISKKEIFWGGMAHFSNFGLSLILLPFVLKYMSEGEIGLWYIFLTIGGLAQLAEFGFQPTIARQAAYIYAGAKEILIEGVPRKSTETIDVNLLHDFIAASKYIYRIIAIIASAILLIVGYVFISHANSGIDDLKTLQSWCVYALSISINLYFGYYNGLLTGRGEQSKANKIIIASRLTSIIVAIPLLQYGLGLNGLAIASLFSCLVSRCLYAHFFNSKNYNATRSAKRNLFKVPEYTMILWHSSKKLGFAQLGSYLILRGNFFVVSATMGLQITAAYGLTLQVLGLISALTTMIFTLQLPHINRLQTQGRQQNIKELYISSQILSLTVFAAGATCIVAFGDVLLSLLKSNAHLIPINWLVALSVIMLLELHHSLAATYLTTLNTTPFLASSLISGTTILAASILIATQATSPNLGFLILTQGIVQLLYNNWKWPYEAAKQLALTYQDYVRTIFFRP